MWCVRSSAGTDAVVLVASFAAGSAGRAAYAVAVASCYHLHLSPGQVAVCSCTAVVPAAGMVVAETAVGVACSAAVVVVAFAVVASPFDSGSFVVRWDRLGLVG